MTENASKDGVAVEPEVVQWSPSPALAGEASSTVREEGMSLERIPVGTLAPKDLIYVEGSVALSNNEGTLYTIAKKGAIARPTVSGYYALNKIAGVTILTPPSLKMPYGDEKPNPYLKLNDQGKVEEVWVWKVAVGYAPTGQLVRVDQKLYLNLKDYLLQSLMEAAKKWAGSKEEGTRHPEWNRKTGFLGAKDVAPKEGAWAWYPIEDPVGFHFNLEDPDVVECFVQHVNRQRFAERMAVSIAERNCLKKHPAIAIDGVQVDVTGKAVVRLGGYKQSIAKEQLERLVTEATTLASPVGDFVKAETEEVEEAAAHVDDGLPPQAPSPAPSTIQVGPDPDGVDPFTEPKEATPNWYRVALARLLMRLAPDNPERQRAFLKKCSSFTSKKDGKVVPGKEVISDLSDAWAKAAWQTLVASVKEMATPQQKTLL